MNVLEEHSGSAYTGHHYGSRRSRPYRLCWSFGTTTGVVSTMSYTATCGATSLSPPVFPHHTRLSDIVCRQRRMCSSNFPRSLPAQTVLISDLWLTVLPAQHLCNTCSLSGRFCVSTNTWGLPLPDMSALTSDVSFTAPCNHLTIRTVHSGHVGNKSLLCFKTACFS
jgi:hypothetical protein